MRASLVAIGATIACLAAASPPAGAQLRIAGGRHVRIPIDVRNNHVFVRGRVNDSDSLWIIVDTGAQSSAIDLGLAHRLSLPTVRETEALGAGGAEQGFTVSGVTIRMPGLELRRPEIDAFALEAFSAMGGRPWSVILGSELFMKHVVEIDYAARMMDVWDPDAYPRPRTGFSLGMTLVENHPYVEGTLRVPGRKALHGRFVIDVGSGSALIVAPDAVQRQRLVDAFPRTLKSIGRGVGGQVTQVVGRAESFELGPVRIDGPTVVCPTAIGGRISAPGTLGNIGGEVLRRFRVVFDYPRGRVGFHPNAALAEPFEADMSGAIYLPAADGAARVLEVGPGTPAAEAGLRPEDLVEAVDGVPVGSIGFAAFREGLKRGRDVRYAVRRGERFLAVTLRLRRLI